MNSCTIIGLTDRREQWFAPEVRKVIAEGKVFSGGRRHHEIVSSLLPEDALWIDITVPLAKVFERYEEYDDIVIFASGDPLFFGFANTVRREVPECEVRVFPAFNSLQMLAHRMLLPYHDMHVVSLTGRPWHRFDEALIRGEMVIGVLTDKRHTPYSIALRMHEYGYDNYNITIGENLGNERSERISETLPIPAFIDLGERDYDINCLILQRTAERQHPFGIPEEDFHLLNGRVNMITKMPIRLLSLAMLSLGEKKSFWDVGFCTGSVSIEAKLQFPHLYVTAFEVREEGRMLMQKNSERFGAPGIETVIGDFLTIDVNGYERPDAVFIGGHGGRLKEMLHKIRPLLNEGGCIVFNSVSEESRTLFYEGIAEVGMRVVKDTLMAVDTHNPIHIMKAE